MIAQSFFRTIDVIQGPVNFRHLRVLMKSDSQSNAALKPQMVKMGQKVTILPSMIRPTEARSKTN